MSRRLQHVLAATFSAALVVFLAWDRRSPLSYVKGEMFPRRPLAGQAVTVRWTTDWYRACEAEVSRETIGADLVVRAYLKFNLRIPTRLGPQSADSNFILSEALPAGLTAYNATLRFSACGVTSHIWPLSIETPTLYFEVVR